MTGRDDWERVNLGCLFSEMNNSIGEFQRVLEDDKQFRERFLSEEEYYKIADVIRLLGAKRFEVIGRIDRIFESAKAEEDEKSKEDDSEKKEDSEEEDEEYRIEPESEEIQSNIAGIVIHLRKKE